MATTTSLNTMSKWVYGALLAFLCSYYGSAFAAPSVPASETPKAVSRYERGLLWRITPSKGQPSYILGTIHSDDPRVLALPKPVASALDRSRSFTMELVIDLPAIAAMAERMYYTDGRTLAGVVGKTVYQDTRKALTAHGVPLAGLEKQKPWVPLMALSAPVPKGAILDMVLAQRAAAAGKPVYGLESVEEQLGLFDDIPLPDQVLLLKHTAADYQEHNVAQLFDKMIRAYVARDLAGILKAAEESPPPPGAKRAYDDFMRRLLDGRNQRMVERMEPRLREGNAFIAIGALHLNGRQGVLERLSRQGYRVSPVY